MEKWVQIFKCIISHSSTKSLMESLFFAFFWEKTLCTYWLVNIWRGWKKIVPSESRIAIFRLFIVRFRKVCWCFLHCTLECLRPYVPTTSFRLRTKVECLIKSDYYFIRENQFKDALNHREHCEIAIRT